MNLHGVLAPICTHFHPDGGLALDQLSQNIEHYNRSDLLGYVATGTTGEAPMLSERERLQVWETVAKAAPGKLLIAGTGAQSTFETLSLTRHAAQLGYHAALVLIPSFFRGQMQTPAVQLDFFRAVADASPIPVMLYDFPQMTNVDLSPETLAQAAGHANVIALKESSADMEKIRQLRAALPSGFPLLVGASAMFDTCMELGADGGVLAIANALPNAACRIFEAFAAGDIAAAKQAQQHIREAASTAPKYGIQGLKYGMSVRGFQGGPCRHPLPILSQAAMDAIRPLFEALDD